MLGTGKLGASIGNCARSFDKPKPLINTSSWINKELSQHGMFSAISYSRRDEIRVDVVPVWDKLSETERYSVVCHYCYIWIHLNCCAPGFFSLHCSSRLANYHTSGSYRKVLIDDLQFLKPLLLPSRIRTLQQPKTGFVLQTQPRREGHVLSWVDQIHCPVTDYLFGIRINHSFKTSHGASLVFKLDSASANHGSRRDRISTTIGVATVKKQKYMHMSRTRF